MLFRQLLREGTACASYLLGCRSKRKLAVVDPHVELVDDYIALAAAQEIPIVAVLETHLQADHVSGLPALVERTGATAYLPGGAGVEFEHVALRDEQTVELGNTELRAMTFKFGSCVRLLIMASVRPSEIHSAFASLLWFMNGITAIDSIATSVSFAWRYERIPNARATARTKIASEPITVAVLCRFSPLTMNSALEARVETD